MGSAISSVTNAVGGLLQNSATGQLLGGLQPKYTDTDALQGIAQQQIAGAQDAQAQLTGLKDQRSEFGQALANQALGKAPSIAEAQLKMAMDRNLSQQVAAAKANRAVNPALQARNVGNAASQMAQSTAQQSAVNRLAEQQQAQSMFGQYLGQQQSAGASYLGGASNSQNAVMNQQNNNAQRGTNMLSGLAQAGMSMAMMSDKNLKTLVKKYDKGSKKEESKESESFDPKSFLDALSATSFEYKKGAQGPGVDSGRKLGVMAQDLEKAGPVGKSMVKETPQGKQVDFGTGFSAILASQAQLNERLKAIESKWGKKESK